MGSQSLKTILIAGIIIIIMAINTKAVSQAISARPTNSLGLTDAYSTLFPVGGGWGAGTSALAPVSGTMKDLNVFLTVPVGGEPCVTEPNNSRIFTLTVNGVESDLACTVQCGDTSHTCSDLTSEVTISEGDQLYIKAEATQGEDPPPATEASFSMTFDTNSDHASTSILMGGSQIDVNSTNWRFYPLSGLRSGETDRYETFTVIPFDANVYRFFVKTAIAPGIGKEWDFNLLKVPVSGASSSVIGFFCRIQDNETECLNETDEVTFSAGDGILVQGRGINSPALIGTRFGFSIALKDINDTNKFVLGATTDDAIHQTNIEDFYSSAGDGSFTTYDESKSIVNDMNATNIYVQIREALGIGNTLDLNLNRNDVTNTLNCKMLGGFASFDTCNESGLEAYSSGDFINWEYKPNSTPSAITGLSVSVAGQRPGILPSEEAPDYCAYEYGTGDYNVSCNLCNDITESVDLDGNQFIINNADGAGEITITADINGCNRWTIEGKCTVTQAGSVCGT